MSRSEYHDWVERYVRAWNSNDPEEIAALFTDDAVYVTGPFDPPWEGREAIVRNWIENKDEPGNTEFVYEVMAIDGDLGIVQGRTKYLEPPALYANLWLIRLAGEGRASEYTEWWIKEK